MKMIYYDLSMWQTSFDRWTKGSAHIHADGFHGTGIIESPKETTDGFQRATFTDFQYASIHQIAQNCVVGIPFASCKFIDA
jgi:hypothetical protein